MELLSYIQTIVPLTPALSAHIKAIFQKEDFARKTVLYKEGQPVNKLYFIESGLARMYYINKQGKEVSYGFYSEGQFVTIPESFFNQTASRYYLELLENSTLQHITHPQFESLIATIPEVKEIESHVLRYFLQKASERIIALQFQSAEERYLSLFESLPTILHRAPLGAVASYLGITQETLSRIRARITT